MSWDGRQIQAYVSGRSVGVVLLACAILSESYKTDVFSDASK